MGYPYELDGDTFAGYNQISGVQMSQPFSPPNTLEETPDQLRNLYQGLKRLAQVPQMEVTGATAEEVATKINEVIAIAGQITRGSDVRRRS